jgi:hypothetical protein
MGSRGVKQKRDGTERALEPLTDCRVLALPLCNCSPNQLDAVAGSRPRLDLRQ